jgi:cytochrome c biogenesis protein CcmG/thiol:disulfide interchange protein DsbE
MGVPETFVIDRDGTVVYKHTGPVTEGQLAAVIEPLLVDATAASTPTGSQ